MANKRDYILNPLSREEKDAEIKRLLEMDEQFFDGADYSYRNIRLKQLGFDTSSGFARFWTRIEGGDV